MAQKIVKIWYDQEGDYLEVIFEKGEGYFKETEDDQVMEKVDSKGNILGFSVLKVSRLRKRPLWTLPFPDLPSNAFLLCQQPRNSDGISDCSL